MVLTILRNSSTDNGSNFVRAVELMLSENVTEEHIRCACHTLQLSVKKAIEVRNSSLFLIRSTFVAVPDCPACC